MFVVWIRTPSAHNPRLTAPDRPEILAETALEILSFATTLEQVLPLQYVGRNDNHFAPGADSDRAFQEG